MACYGQLLLLCGGGVIDHAKQVERQDEATLVIGLGGTGSDAVMKLKREVFKQLKPDDEQTAIPTYAAIKYLIVDSDDSKIDAQTGRFTDIDRNTEYFDFKNMGELLEQYKKLLIKLDHNFFAVLTQMLETLKETFAKNAEVLSEGIKEENTYTWKIVSVKDIKEGLDEDVKNLDLNQTLYALMMDLFENCKKWINQDENEISKLISDFVLGQFSTVAKKTMTDYLKEKFCVDNATLLEQKIEDAIIQKELWSKSTPLFWKNSMYNRPVGEQNILTVPFDSLEICNAANNFAEKKRITLRRSGIIDKMSVMRFYSGLPMYAYQEIQELERAYETDLKLFLPLEPHIQASDQPSAF